MNGILVLVFMAMVLTVTAIYYRIKKDDSQKSLYKVLAVFAWVTLLVCLYKTYMHALIW